MKKNGHIEEIRQILNSAEQDTPLTICKKQCKIITPLALLFFLGFMAETTYVLCKLSDDIKEAKQAATLQQSELSYVHSPSLETPLKKSIIL